MLILPSLGAALPVAGLVPGLIWPSDVPQSASEMVISTCKARLGQVERTGLEDGG